jgi:hypothetical protein
MLDIPTATTTTKGAKSGTRTPEQREKFLARQPTGQYEPTTAGGDVTAGTTSLGETAPTAYDQTTPYEYGGQGWNDPVAQGVMQNYYASTPGYSADTYGQLKGMAEAGSGPGVQYNTPLDPSTWGTVYRGPDYDKMIEDYKAAGGTYYNQFTPAQQAGVPYIAATGEAAPVMNMQTGVAETPTFGPTGKVTGQTPTSATTSGSYHAVEPEILNKMWR